MELTRNWKSLKTGVMLLLVGVVFSAAPTLLDLVGYEFRLGSWVGYVMGGLGVLGGIFLIVDGIARYRIGVSERGLDLRVAGLTAEIPWEQVDLVVVERDTNVTKNPPLVLVLIPSAGAELPKKAEYDSRCDGRKGIRLIEVDQLREGQIIMTSVLSQHAGAKFVNLQGTPAGS